MKIFIKQIWESGSWIWFLLLISLLLLLIFACSKKTCWDCVAKDKTTGHVVNSSTPCSQEGRDHFLNLYSTHSTVDAECNPL